MGRRKASRAGSDVRRAGRGGRVLSRRTVPGVPEIARHQEDPVPAPTTTTTRAAAIGAAPQAMLVDAALTLLRERGYDVRRGTYGDLDTAEVAVAGGRRLVLLPMAETLWGDAEHPDVDVWH